MDLSKAHNLWEKEKKKNGKITMFLLLFFFFFCKVYVNREKIIFYFHKCLKLLICSVGQNQS